MKAIRTRYSGPTNTRGSRIHATDSDGNQVSVPHPYHLHHEDAHKLAAYTLMQKMKWPNVLQNGSFGHDEYWTMYPYVTGQAPMYEIVLANLKGEIKCTAYSPYPPFAW